MIWRCKCSPTSPSRGVSRWNASAVPPWFQNSWNPSRLARRTWFAFRGWGRGAWYNCATHSRGFDGSFPTSESSSAGGDTRATGKRWRRGLRNGARTHVVTTLAEALNVLNRIQPISQHVEPSSPPSLPIHSAAP